MKHANILVVFITKKYLSCLALYVVTN